MQPQAKNSGRSSETLDPLRIVGHARPSPSRGVIVSTNYERSADLGLAALTPSPIWATLGMKLIALDPGRATMALEATSRVSNIQGAVHGGAIATLADTAMGAACWTLVEEGVPFATLDLNISFLKSVREGQLIATGSIIRPGRSVHFAECGVTDGTGALIARASCTFHVR
jgi:uncharacterized protein (TIGR00369 family)